MAEPLLDVRLHRAHRPRVALALRRAVEPDHREAAGADLAVDLGALATLRLPTIVRARCLRPAALASTAIHHHGHVAPGELLAELIPQVRLVSRHQEQKTIHSLPFTRARCRSDRMPSKPVPPGSSLAARCYLRSRKTHWWSVQL